MQSGATHSSSDYAKLVATLVQQLSTEKAAQLYSYARFLLADTQADLQDDIAFLTDEELAAEDQVWSAALTRHADKFAELKAQAKADAKAGKGILVFE